MPEGLQHILKTHVGLPWPLLRITAGGRLLNYCYLVSAPRGHRRRQRFVINGVRVYSSFANRKTYTGRWGAQKGFLLRMP